MNIAGLKRLVHWAYLSLTHRLTLKEEEFLEMQVRISLEYLEEMTAPEFPIDWYEELAKTIQENLVRKGWYHPRLNGAYLKGLADRTWDDVITEDFRVYVCPKL